MTGVRNRRLIGLFLGAGLIALAGCGDADKLRGVTADAAEAPVTEAATTMPTAATSTAATTTAPATTVAPTTLEPATTPAPLETTTTAAPVTLPAEILPQPEAPPPADAVEPIVEVGTIEIPRIGVSKTMYDGVSLGVLDHGPGHWPGTAGPGQVGNMVVAGHRMSHDHPFRDVDQLVPGDEMFVTDTTGARFLYTVASTEIVTPDAIRIIEQTPASTATLFACHPKGSTRERIVVHLELVGPV